MPQDKFQNKYRNGTFRAQWWDYGWNGAYFITICTQNREHYFGEIKNGIMILSHIGLIAAILWNEIPKHHEHIELGEFVVMPNHVHGILIIHKPNDGRIIGPFDHGGDENDWGNIVAGVGHALHLPRSPGSQRFQNIGNNTISSAVGSYKSAVTKYANRLGYPNGWQRLFHEHIIRNETEYMRIANYIVANPENWPR